MTNLFDKDDLRVQLADRMGIDAEGFNPMHNVKDDYDVLVWMRTIVQTDYPGTYRIFISYMSGAMHHYVVGDFAKNAMLAIGIIDSSNETTGNE